MSDACVRAGRSVADGRAWIAFDGDAQSQPPDGELRQIIEAVRAAKGSPFSLQIALGNGKQLSKRLDDGRLLARREGFTGQKIASGLVFVAPKSPRRQRRLWPGAFASKNLLPQSTAGLSIVHAAP